jgi:hypothetical protein
MPGKSLWLIILVFTLTIAKANAQNLSADTPMYTADAQQAIDNYNTAIAYQSEIYNGAAYAMYPAASRGSAYFNDAIFAMPGAIRYNGIVYKNIPLLYDMYADVFVAAQRNILFVLRPDRLSDVYLHGHHFIKLSFQKDQNLTPGFYDELYSGKSQVLVKRARQVNNITSAQTIETIYENEDVIYIKKDNNYYKVDGKHSVLNVFKDKKRQLSRFLSDKGIRYKNDKEAGIVKLAIYYDQLTN